MSRIDTSYRMDRCDGARKYQRDGKRYWLIC